MLHLSTNIKDFIAEKKSSQKNERIFFGVSFSLDFSVVLSIDDFVVTCYYYFHFIIKCIRFSDETVCPCSD